MPKLRKGETPRTPFEKPKDYSKLMGDAQIQGTGQTRESILVQNDYPTIENYRRIQTAITKDLSDASSFADVTIPANFLITRILIYVRASTNNVSKGVLILSWIGKNTLQIFNSTYNSFVAGTPYREYVNFMDTSQLYTKSGGTLRLACYDADSLSNPNSSVILCIWGFQY